MSAVIRLADEPWVWAGLIAAALWLALLAVRVSAADALLRAAFAWQRRRAGLRARAITLAGHRWVYAEGVAAHDDAPGVVMIHGFTGSKENWYPLARAWRRTGARLWLPDLPGWGESTRVPGARYDYAAQAERVAAFIAAVSPQRPVLLVGHSMGGAIAVLVAAHAPTRVAALALIAPAGAPFTENAFAREVLAGGHPFAVHDRASLRRYLRLLFPDPRTRPWLPWPVSSAYLRRRRRDDAFEREVSAAMAGPERFLPEAEAGAIHVPACLLWGADDPIIAPDAAQAYAARMPQATVVVVPQAGHMVLMEQPQTVATALRPLLDTVQRAGEAGLR